MSINIISNTILSLDFCLDKAWGIYSVATIA
jgi:hypothetical protein